MGKSALSVGTGAWAAKVNTAWRSSVEGIIEAGRILLDCKKQIPHGDFTSMIQNQLDFTPSVARKLMAIAKDARLQNALNGHALPGHWTTLYELHKLDNDQLEAALAGGPNITRASAQRAGASGKPEDSQRRPKVIDVDHKDITADGREVEESGHHVSSVFDRTATALGLAVALSFEDALSALDRCHSDGDNDPEEQRHRLPMSDDRFMEVVGWLLEIEDVIHRERKAVTAA